jgi:hypothetical protein
MSDKPKMNFYERHWLESELEDFHEFLLEAIHSEDATDYILAGIEMAKDRNLTCNDETCKQCESK